MTTLIQIGTTASAVIQFYDGLPDGSGNPTGSEIVLGHAATWGAVPADVTIATTGDQSAILTGAVVASGIVLTATDPTSGFTASASITVTAAPVPPEVIPPESPHPPSVEDPPPPFDETAGSTPQDYLGDQWWGDFTAPIYGPSIGIGYTPPPVAPHGVPPVQTLMGYDSGLIRWVFTG